VLVLPVEANDSEATHILLRYEFLFLQGLEVAVYFAVRTVDSSDERHHSQIFLLRKLKQYPLTAKRSKHPVKLHCSLPCYTTDQVLKLNNVDTLE